MELMDTSLDKFYKQVIEKGMSIPEDILGKIAVSVGSLIHQPPLPIDVRCLHVLMRFVIADRKSFGASAQQPAGHPQR